MIVFGYVSALLMGMTLGPITGQVAAESILDGQAAVNIGRLGADRF